MAEQLSEAAIMELLQQQYPEYLPILAKPGIHDVLFQAVRENWTEPRLNAALKTTPYYRQTNASDRAWDMLSIVDPSTAQQRYATYQQKINDLHLQLGVSLPPDVGARLVQQAAANQWTDAEFRTHIMNDPALTPTGAAPQGEVGTHYADVKTLASNYGVPMSDMQALQYANQLTSGAINADGLKGNLIAQAKSMFPNDPNLAQALDQGQTVAQYADPYKQIAVRELNINPGDFNLSDPKWQSALQQVDPKTGMKIPQSLDQWQNTVRTDPKFGYDMTQNAATAASQLTTQLAQKMGAV